MQLYFYKERVQGISLKNLKSKSLYILIEEEFNFPDYYYQRCPNQGDELKWPKNVILGTGSLLSIRTFGE